MKQIKSLPRPEIRSILGPIVTEFSAQYGKARAKVKKGEKDLTTVQLERTWEVKVDLNFLWRVLIHLRVSGEGQGQGGKAAVSP